MSMLYEKVYRQKIRKFEQDGDLKAFNAFISKAQEFQISVAENSSSEMAYSEWLKAQMC